MNEMYNIQKTLNELELQGTNTESMQQSILKLLESHKFYGDMKAKFDVVKWEKEKIDELQPGDIVYCDLGLGYARELRYGHWCYVVKKVGLTKVLVIPLTSDHNHESDYKKAIKTQINGINTTSTLSLTDIRYMDTMRIDFRKGKGTCCEPISKIKQFIIKILVESEE